jgi:hypothetical protein
MPVDHIRQGLDPRDEAIIVKTSHPGLGLSERMNKGVTQEDARYTAPCYSLVEVEHVRGHLSIGSRHTLGRRRLDEAIFETQFTDGIRLKKNRHLFHSFFGSFLILNQLKHIERTCQ